MYDDRVCYDRFDNNFYVFSSLFDHTNDVCAGDDGKSLCTGEHRHAALSLTHKRKELQGEGEEVSIKVKKTSMGYLLVVFLFIAFYAWQLIIVFTAEVSFIKVFVRWYFRTQ